MRFARFGHRLFALVVLGAGSVVAACGGLPSHTISAPPIPAFHASSRTETFGPGLGHSGQLGAVLTSGDGSQIFGFDVGQKSSAGILSTATHIETFDQQTGAITSSFPKIVPPRTTYAMDGIFPGDIALITKYVMPKGSIYAKRFYGVIRPFTAGGFTGTWTPPVKDVDVLQGAEDVATSTSALFAIELENNDKPDLFVSDIAKNTFGKTIHLDNNLFCLCDGPSLGSYLVDGKAVFALSPDGGAVGGSAPVNVLIDTKTGAVTQFTGYNNGFFHAGYVNGAATDPNTGVLVTTTELNAQVEFYDVRKRKGITATQLPCTGDTDQTNSGAGIAVDTVHKLFLVADPYYECDNSQDGAVVVYDERGNEVEAITGFATILAEPAAALDMTKRVGWSFGPHFDQLQQFFY